MYLKKKYLYLDNKQYLDFLHDLPYKHKWPYDFERSTAHFFRSHMGPYKRHSHKPQSKDTRYQTRILVWAAVVEWVYTDHSDPAPSCPDKYTSLFSQVQN